MHPEHAALAVEFLDHLDETGDDHIEVALRVTGPVQDHAGARVPRLTVPREGTDLLGAETRVPTV